MHESRDLRGARHFLLRLAALAAVASASSPAAAFFVDGEGHYALRGQTETSPGFSKKTGYYQAIEQSFSLRGEARVSDTAGMHLELRLFDDDRAAYLGDKAQPHDCQPDRDPNGKVVAPADPNDPCAGAHQNTGEPGYQPYKPRITQAYFEYAFDYCLVKAGRRARDWGLGIFLSDGTKPFDTDQSLFDGVSCDINIQKSQTLGFSFGYDKLAETGTFADRSAAHDPAESRTFGPTDTSDDLDQYFFTINFDDRKANAGAAFTKQVGVYFSQVSSRKVTDGGSGTDIKFFDLYTGFYFLDLALKNEFLFRMGRSGDPNWQMLGGARDDGSDPAVNKLDSIGFAGALEWTASRSGAPLGPTEYNQGDASRHVVFLNYAYAPGEDKGGGLSDDLVDPACKGRSDLCDPNKDDNLPLKYGHAARTNKVTAMAFNRNYKPALLLFNQKPVTDRYRVDGVFNPSRVENATVLGLGYRYESQQNGNFEIKAVTAQLNHGVDGGVKEYYAYLDEVAPDLDDGSRPAGYYGKNLGVELDLGYGYKFGREAEVGGAIAGAMPGNAWRVEVEHKPTSDFMLQAYGAFHF
jgi:hypothetical protein